jgi:hypothetical protein
MPSKGDVKVLTPYMVDAMIEAALDGEGPTAPCGCGPAQTGIRHASSGERARYGDVIPPDGLWVRYMACRKCRRRWEGQVKP